MTPYRMRRLEEANLLARLAMKNRAEALDLSPARFGESPEREEFRRLASTACCICWDTAFEMIGAIPAPSSTRVCA